MTDKLLLQLGAHRHQTLRSIASAAGLSMNELIRRQIDYTLRAEHIAAIAPPISGRVPGGA